MDGQIIMLAGAGILTTAVVGAGVRLGWWRDDRARNVGRVEPAIWLLCAAMMWMMPVVGVGLVGGLSERIVGSADSVQRKALMQVCGYGYAIVLALVTGLIVRRRVGRRTGLEMRLEDVWRGVVLLLMAAPVYLLVGQASHVVSEWWTGSGGDSVKHETLKQLMGGEAAKEWVGWRVLLIFSVTVLAPAVEEVTYRGFLQSFFLRVLRGPADAVVDGEGEPRGRRGMWCGWGAVLATSAVFAPMHAVGGTVPWSAVPGLFVLSVAMGWAFEKTGRLGVPIVMHAVFNGVNVAMVMWAGGK